MNCEEVRELLIDALDGTLPPERSGAVAAHLRDCGACREELEALREAEAAVRSIPRVAAPADFLARVNARIDAEAAAPAAAAPAKILEMRPRRYFAPPKALVGLAAGVLLAGVSVVFFATFAKHGSRSAPGDASTGGSWMAPAEGPISAASKRLEDLTIAQDQEAVAGKAAQGQRGESFDRFAAAAGAAQDASRRVLPAQGLSLFKSANEEEPRTLTVTSADVESARSKVMATLARNSVALEPAAPEPASGTVDSTRLGAPAQHATIFYCDVSPQQYAAITNELRGALDLVVTTEGGRAGGAGVHFANGVTLEDGRDYDAARDAREANLRGRFEAERRRISVLEAAKVEEELKAKADAEAASRSEDRAGMDQGLKPPAATAAPAPAPKPAAPEPADKAVAEQPAGALKAPDRGKLAKLLGPADGERGESPRGVEGQKSVEGRESSKAPESVTRAKPPSPADPSRPGLAPAPPPARTPLAGEKDMIARADGKSRSPAEDKKKADEKGGEKTEKGAATTRDSDVKKAESFEESLDVPIADGAKEAPPAAHAAPALQAAIERIKLLRGVTLTARPEERRIRLRIEIEPGADLLRLDRTAPATEPEAAPAPSLEKKR